MAIHPNLPSMLKESLPEMLLVAKYCIEFQKDPDVWGESGCYGYPAALLLLSIADSIGSYVKQGSILNHFKILNDRDYYGLELTEGEIRIIYHNYRNLLSHNTLIATNVGLRIGTVSDKVLLQDGNRFWLNLVPFYDISAKAVNSFLSNQNVLNNNQTILDIQERK